MLTPLDIQNKEFKRGFRGFNEEEVTEFLEVVCKDYEKLYRDNIELKEANERLASKLEHYQTMEETMRSTLVIAQETAEEVKLNAKKEMELMLKESEIKSQKMVEEAIAKVRKMTSEYEEIKRQAQIFRTRFRTLLQAQLEMIGLDDEEA